MKVNFNWGTGLTIAIILFCSLFLVLIFKTTQYPVHLVADNYYEQEVRYQERIERINNANSLETAPKLQYDLKENLLKLQLPTSLVNVDGKIRFFRPSNPQLDFDLTLDLDSNNQQSINALRMQSGLWKVMIDWTDTNGRAYYNEQKLVIP